MNKKSNPPRMALHFLLRFMDPDERENFKAYVDSVYKERLFLKSRRAARTWF